MHQLSELSVIIGEKENKNKFIIYIALMQAFKKQKFQINMKCWQENPNWQEADQLAIYTVQQKS